MTDVEKFTATSATQRSASCIRLLGTLKVDVESGKRDYRSLRKRFLFLNAYLNEPWHGHGPVGPAYRPRVTYEKFEGQDVSELIFEDQYRIDVHWLLCSDGTIKAEHCMGALYAGEEIPESSCDPFICEGDRMVMSRGWTCQQLMDCIWICYDTVRVKRDSLLEERDAHFSRLQERLRTTEDVGERNSLSKIDLLKLCNIWLAEEIALLMFDRQKLSLEKHAEAYRKITGDRSLRRGSIRHQRAQVARYIRGHSILPTRSGNSLSVRRARGPGPGPGVDSVR